MRSARGGTELLGSRRLLPSKLETACLSDSCCTRVLLEEGPSARGEDELLGSRHLSLLGVLHARSCSRRVRSTLGGVDAARWGEPSSSARDDLVLLGVLHASSCSSVHTLDPGLRLCSAQGETELLSSRRLCSSQRASRSLLSQRARARTWCPLAQRSRRNGASGLEKTLFFSACFTLVSIATCARWDLVSACAALEEKRSF